MCALLIPLIFFLFFTVEEICGTQYQSGSFSLFNVGNCLRVFFRFFKRVCVFVCVCVCVCVFVCVCVLSCWCDDLFLTTLCTGTQMQLLLYKEK